MKKALWLSVVLLFSAAAHPDNPPSPATPDDSQLVEHRHYQEVHSPAHSKTGTAPAGATAKCRDGTYSFSQHRSGTCSHHGGVLSRL